MVRTTATSLIFQGSTVHGFRSRIARSARSYHNDWAGLTEPRVVGEALEGLRELGWIRPEAALARDGGRPTVRFHINPRVTSR